MSLRALISTHRSSLGFWILLFAILPTLSCNKQTRARRFLQASEKAYAQARSGFLARDLKACQTESLKAKINAEKAVRLWPSGPGSEGLVRQKEKCSFMANALQDPRACFQMWLQALVDGDLELGMSLVDTEALAKSSLSRRISRMSESEQKTFYEVFRKSSQKTFEMYREAVASWQVSDIQCRTEGETAEVDAMVKTLNADRRVQFSFRREDGLWTIEDFSVLAGQLSQFIQNFEILLPEDTNMSHFLEGKGLLEAFSGLQGAQQVDRMFLQKPLLGHYVKLQVPMTFTTPAGEATLEAGTTLKIIDQVLREGDAPTYVVRTTEADPAMSAKGLIPADKTIYVGTDESEMWGTDSAAEVK